MIRIGLTGSIGMGKSTTAAMFAELGIPVIDADAIVHELYRGAAVGPVGAAFPGVVKDGVIDRKALAEKLASDPDGFKRLEAIVHPMVAIEERRLITAATDAGSDLIVLDIPLLFENHAEGRVDTIVVVSCDPEIQRQRVLARPGMTEEKFAMILSRQMPDREKRARADYIVDSGKGLEEARKMVGAIVADVRQTPAKEREGRS